MKIGIDGYEANTDMRVGIGQFAYGVLNAMWKNPGGNEFIIFVPNKKASDLPPAKKGWEYREIPSRKLWTYNALPKAIIKESLDIFFSPTHYVPLFCPVPRIFAIMDLSYLYYPGMFRFKDLIKLRLGTRYSVFKAKTVVTISNFSKNDIIKHYHVPQKNIFVAYPGFNSELFHPPQKHQSDSDYVLFTGTLQPRKNIVRLLEAFNQLSNRSIKLLITGKKGWLYNEIFAKVKELKMEGRVEFKDFVTDLELAGLMQQAKCLVLPSLYEGFGIPAVEAMAVGCPVVVSNISSLPEIVETAGILVNPLETASIKEGLEKVLSFSQKERTVWSEKGKKQAEKFSWDQCAKQLNTAFTYTYENTA